MSDTDAGVVALWQLGAKRPFSQLDGPADNREDGDDDLFPDLVSDCAPLTDDAEHTNVAVTLGTRQILVDDALTKRRRQLTAIRL